MVVLWGYCGTFKELPATAKYHLFTIPNFITLRKIRFFSQKISAMLGKVGANY
jgi:hypothetical protein